MSKNTLIIVIVIILVLLGIWYFVAPGGTDMRDINDTRLNQEMGDDMDDMDMTPTDDSEQMQTGTNGPVGTPTNPTTSTSTTDAGNVKSFTVTGSNFKFSVPEMRVKQGDTVKITFASAGGTHDLKIDEFNAATQVLRAGDPAQTIQFVANKKGTFEYYCSVGTHRQMGMVGKLIVE